jgi:Flp pilus assembly pilin Flp
MYPFLQKLWNDESGQDLAEYALILALIAVALVTGVGVLRGAIESRFEAAADVLNEAE